MSAPIALRGEDLAASYSGRPVFDCASLALGCGLHALEGPNGSGKSTLLRLLAGAQMPDRGEVEINGISLARSPEAARRALSYVPAESPIYPFMTGRELLRFVAMAKRVELDGAVLDLAADLGILPQLHLGFDAMSLGTQKKMLLTAGWIGTPRVMLLDEPSNGLDKEARQALARKLRACRDTCAILFATHDLEFVAATEASVITMAEVAGSAVSSGRGDRRSGRG